MLRTILLTMVLAYGVQAGLERAREQRPSPDIEAAIGVRCGELRGSAKADCQMMLQQRFEVGEVKPRAILRTHCTRWQSPWTLEQGHGGSNPPDLCVDRFGGWIRS